MQVIRKWIQANLHWCFLGLMIFVSFWGFKIIYDSRAISEADMGYALYYPTKYAIWIIAGIITFLALQLFKIPLKKADPTLLVGCAIFFCALTEIFGCMTCGAKRFIIFYGVSLNTGHLTELILILALCVKLYKDYEDGIRDDFFYWLFNISVILLLFNLPNRIQVFCIAIVFIIILNLFAKEKRIPRILAWTAISIYALLFVGISAYGVHLGIANTGIENVNTGIWFFDSYLPNKINSVLMANPFDDGYQQLQSAFCFADGGLFGAPPQAVSNLTDSLWDGIFPKIGADYGFVGLLGVGGFFLLFLHFGLQAAMRTKDRMEAILCTSLTLMIEVYAFVGMLTSVGLLFPNGIGIPFFSYTKLHLIFGWITAALIFKILRRKDAQTNLIELPYKKVLVVFMILFVIILLKVLYLIVQVSLLTQLQLLK